MRRPAARSVAVVRHSSAMPSHWTRRAFLSAAAALTACGGVSEPAGDATASAKPRLGRDRVCFITDEVSADLAEAIAFAKEFGVGWVEIRNLWDKYGILQDVETIRKARTMLDDAGLKVTALSTPLLKCIAPGVKPIERVEHDIEISERVFPIPNDEQFGRSVEFLERSIEAASILGCTTIRCFSFWRTEDPASSYPLLLEKLEELAPIARKAGMRLAMENEHACNVADCGEAMQVLAKAPAGVGLLWDVLNGVSTGEQPYPDGYAKLDKARLFHVQLKDADLTQGVERFKYTPIGEGGMPYTKIFEALAADGYPGTVSMETHFKVDGSSLEASRRSMRGLLAAIDAQA